MWDDGVGSFLWVTSGFAFSSLAHQRSTLQNLNQTSDIFWDNSITTKASEEVMSQGQTFSQPLHCWHFGAAYSCVVRSWPVHCRMFSSSSGLYLWPEELPPPRGHDNQNVCRYCQCPWRHGQHCPAWEVSLIKQMLIRLLAQCSGCMEVNQTLEKLTN